MDTKKLTYKQKQKLQKQIIIMGKSHLDLGLHEDLKNCTLQEAKKMKYRYVDFPTMPIEDFEALINMDFVDPHEIEDLMEIGLPDDDDIKVVKFQIYLYDIDDEIFDSFGTIEVFRDPKNLPENSFYRSYWIDGET